MVNEHLIRLVEKNLEWSASNNNPLGNVKRVITEMCDRCSESEINEAIEGALKRLEKKYELEDFFDLEMSRADRDIVGDAKADLRRYAHKDDPVAKVKANMRAFYPSTSTSDIDKAMEVAQVELEFRRKVEELEEKSMPAKSISTNQ